MSTGIEAGAGEAFGDDDASVDHDEEAAGSTASPSEPEMPSFGIPTADRGIGTTPPAEDVPLRGDTLAEQIDALHADMLGGTALGNHTELWNLVHAFKERVKARVAHLERDAS